MVFDVCPVPALTADTTAPATGAPDASVTRPAMVPVLVCAAADQPRIMTILTEAGESPIALGRIVAGERDVRYQPS